MKPPTVPTSRQLWRTWAQKSPLFYLPGQYCILQETWQRILPADSCLLCPEKKKNPCLQSCIHLDFRTLLLSLNELLLLPLLYTVVDVAIRRLIWTSSFTRVPFQKQQPFTVSIMRDLRQLLKFHVSFLVLVACYKFQRNTADKITFSLLY